MKGTGRFLATLVVTGSVTLGQACGTSSSGDVETDTAGSALGLDVNLIDQKCKAGTWKCTERKERKRGTISARRVAVGYKTPNAEGHIGAVFLIKDGIIVAYTAHYAQASSARRSDLDRQFGRGIDDDKGQRTWSTKGGTTHYRLSANGMELQVFSTRVALERKLISKVQSSSTLTPARMAVSAAKMGGASQPATPTPTQGQKVMGTTYALTLMKPTKWVAFEKGKVTQIAFTLKNEQSFPSVPLEFALEVPNFYGTSAGLKPLSLGVVSVPSVAPGESANLVFKLDPNLAVQRYNAELSAVSPAVFGGKKFPVTIDVTPEGGWPTSDLAVTSVGHGLVPHKLTTKVPVTVKVKNVGRGQCSATNPNCVIDGPVTVLVQATSEDGKRVASQSIELKYAGPVKWNEEVTLKGELPFVDGYGFVTKLRAWVIEGGGAGYENDTKEVPFSLSEDAVQAQTMPLVARIELTTLKCNAQNEWFWAWLGGSDEPYLHATAFIPHGSAVAECGRGDNDICASTVHRKYDDVDEGETRSIDAKWVAEVYPGDVSGVHVSLWEEDGSIVLDPDDEIDFAFGYVTYDHLRAIASNGPESFSWNLWGDDADYTINGRITVTSGQPAPLRASKFASVNTYRFDGVYDTVIDGNTSTVTLQASKPAEQYPYGTLGGMWSANNRTEAVRPRRLNGSLFEFDIAHLDAGSKDQRFVGHLIGKKGQEQIVGTTWYGGREYGFHMTKRK